MSGSLAEQEGSSLEVRGIHHVAFVHGDSGVLDGLEGHLGLSCSAPESGPGFVERMFPVGSSYLQTLEACGPGVVQKFVERRGAALHHVALEVVDIDRALEELRSRGTRLLDSHARPGGGRTRIAFIHPSACGGLLVELVQAPAEEPALTAR